MTLIDGYDIFTGASCLPGISGSGLFCKDGRLAGIVKQIFGKLDTGYPFTIATSSEAIQKFLR